MPRKPLTVCAEPGCPVLVPKGRCPAHARPAWHRSSRQSRGYGAEHDKLRRQVAREEPCCAVCGSEGPWHMDHIINQRQGGETVRENLWRLCVPCHITKTQREANEAKQ